MKKTIRNTLTCLAVLVLIIFAVHLFLNSDPGVPRSLGSIRVNIKTYLAGKNQPTHPSVVVFPEEWNGAKYWLAYSPYPYGNGEEENPCLSTSNDLLYWGCPNGLANPIADNEETGCNELKDPHLLYRDDLDRLEMWYLGRLSNELGGDGTSLLLLRKYSYDGTNWSNYEVMSTTNYLSPTVFWNGSKYQMWSIGYDLWNTEGTIVYQESEDGVNWTQPVDCCIGDNSNNIDIWHGSVTLHDGKYHLAFIDNSDKQEIFYCNSDDGIHFSKPSVIVENRFYWDFLYRPTLVFEDNTVTCLYGVVNQENQWYISMSTGEDTSHLIGINESHANKMYSLSDTVIDTHSIQYQIKKTYRSVHTYFRPELLLLVFFETVLLLLGNNFRKKKHIIAVFTCANVLFSFVYITVRLQPSAYIGWFGAIVAICCFNIGMSATLKCISIYLSKEQCSGK